MKQKVVTWDIQEHIQDLMKEYPVTKEYFAWVAERLNCSINEIEGLSVRPEFQKIDKEGWNIESFFETGTSIRRLFTHVNKFADGFAFGDVEEIQVGNDLFIAEVNASPYIVYANPNTIEVMYKI